MARWRTRVQAVRGVLANSTQTCSDCPEKQCRLTSIQQSRACVGMVRDLDTDQIGEYEQTHDLD